MYKILQYNQHTSLIFPRSPNCVLQKNKLQVLKDCGEHCVWILNTCMDGQFFTYSTYFRWSIESLAQLEHKYFYRYAYRFILAYQCPLWPWCACISGFLESSYSKAAFSNECTYTRLSNTCICTYMYKDQCRFRCASSSQNSCELTSAFFPALQEAIPQLRLSCEPRYYITVGID